MIKTVITCNIYKYWDISLNEFISIFFIFKYFYNIYFLNEIFIFFAIFRI